MDNGKNNTNVDKSYKNDGYINSQEMDTAQTTSLTASFLTAEVAVGDKITFSDGNTANNHTVVLSALDVANGYVTSNGNNGSGWALPANKGIINVTTSFIDNAGNTASAEDKAVVDISLASFNALGSVATGGFLQQISFSKPGEAGTYKLHIDNYKITGSNDAPKNYEINGSIDALGRMVGFGGSSYLVNCPLSFRCLYSRMRSESVMVCLVINIHYPRCHIHEVFYRAYVPAMFVRNGNVKFVLYLQYHFDHI